MSERVVEGLADRWPRVDVVREVYEQGFPRAVADIGHARPSVAVVLIMKVAVGT